MDNKIKQTILVALGSALFALAPAQCQPAGYIIGTVAGGGLPQMPLPAVDASLWAPSAVVAEAGGAVYFAVGNLVYKRDTNGLLTRVAGSSAYSGSSGDRIPATSARLDGPRGLALDSAGNLYISETGTGNIRIVEAATGIIRRVAGNGYYGYSGDGGPAILATFASPSGIAIDGSDNLYIADWGNARIRRMSLATGIVTTVAGNGLHGYSGDGGSAASAQLNLPVGVALDGFGNVYIADYGNQRIRKISGATGIITTLAGNGSSGYGGDGGPATAAQFNNPFAVAADASGMVLIADGSNCRVRKVEAGIITTLAGNGEWSSSGDGGPAVGGQIYFPQGVALDGAGNVYITEGNRIRKVSVFDRGITTVAGNGTAGYSGDGGPAVNAETHYPTAVALDSTGNLYILDHSNHLVRRVAAATGVISTVAGNGMAGFSGDGFAATRAQFHYPEGLAVDSSGNLYVSDSRNGRIRRVAAATGIITTVAGNGSYESPGDGLLATSAALYYPSGIALDRFGNLYIADRGSARIRKVSAATGIITTVAGNGSFEGPLGDGGPATSARISYPKSVAVDSAGNIYIADDNNYRIRRVAAATGIISTVVGIGSWGFSGDGGPATNAQLSQAISVAVDGPGDLLIANDSRIRKVSMATGIISTVAGTGNSSFSGDNGPAINATLNSPSGVVSDSFGNLYVADTNNNLVRFLTPGAGRALLSVAKTHIGHLTRGQTGVSYSLSVRNSASAGTTSKTVALSEIIPAGLTLQSMSGTGWNCPLGGSACTRSDALSPGSSYPPVTILVDVAANASPQVTNQVSLTGGGSIPTGASDLSIVFSPGSTPTVPISLISYPAGQTLTVDGITVTTPQTFAWIAGSMHSISAATQSRFGARYVFDNWSHGGTPSHTITVPVTPVTYIANFTTQFLLTADATPAGGGSIHVFPASTDGYYNADTTVQLTATPAAGFSFVAFSGAVIGTANPQFVSMTAPRSVTANFSSGNVPPYGQDLFPYYGAGVAQTFTGVFTDANGWTDIAKATLRFHESYAGTVGACIVEMRPQAGEVTLLDDAGVSFLPPVAIGSSTPLQNSACSVDAAHSSFSGTLNVLMANVALTFKPAFGSAGGREPRKAICQWAKDFAGAGEEQSCFGMWIPEAAAPVTIPRYRLYNPVNFAHFFTASQNERDVLVARGLQPEDPPPGMAYNQPARIDYRWTQPFYRILFFPPNGAPIFHYWTRDRMEYAAAVRDRTRNLGEGIDSFLLSSQVPGSFPTYRLRFTAGPTAYPIYHYALQAETDALIAMGWGVSMGVDGYLQPMSAPLAQVTAGLQTPARKVIAAVLSAASHESGAVAPGQLVRVYGSNFSKLAQAFIDDSAVQLTAVTERYIELAIPETVAGKESIALFVDDLGVRTEAVTLAVTSANPAVFVKDFLGRGMVETLASDPGTITLQVTGVGELDLGQPKLPLTVRLNGYPAEIISISAIADQPGRLAVNVKLPAEVLAADTNLATVSLQAGEANAQPGLLVRVR